MDDAAPLPDRLVRYLQDRRRAGEDGKAVLLGLAGEQPRLALAAGLQGEQDHPGFLSFSRYLLHQRFDCDRFVLWLPAAVSGTPVYMMETNLAGEPPVQLLDSDGRRRPWPHDDCLIGDLARRESALPGIQRREMDRLYEALKLPLP